MVRTDLGGPEARLTIEESIPSLVDVLIAKQGRPGEARTSLEQGRKRLDRSNDGKDWKERLITDLLRRQAEAAVKAKKG